MSVASADPVVLDRVLLAAHRDRLPVVDDHGTVLLDCCDVTDVVDTAHQLGLVQPITVEAGVRWVIRAAPRPCMDPEIETIVDEEMAGLDPVSLRVYAADYLRLRAAVQLTMGDLSPWEGAEPEPVRLARYITHLAGGDHGTCIVCGWLVSATDRYIEFDRRRCWRPRAIWRRLIGLCWSIRYGGRQITHARCHSTTHRPGGARW